MSDSKPTTDTSLQPEPAPESNLVYQAICKLLSGQEGEARTERRSKRAHQSVDWQAFTPDEWQILAQMAEAEGVASLLHWKLDPVRNETIFPIPANVRDFFRRSYEQSAMRNAVLLQELEGILATFGKAELPTIVLKGAALAQTLYPDPGLRPMGDLDLLVRAEALTRAIQLLQTRGYTDERVSDCTCLRGGPEGQVEVAMHGSLVPDGQGRSPDLDWLWGQTLLFPTQKAGRFAQYLQPEAQFVYQCGHLMIQTERSRRRLIWFYDLYLLYRQHLQATDWAALFEAEATAGWAVWMQSALYELRDLFGVQLPPELTGYSA
jgi:hypothetical protein